MEVLPQVIEGVGEAALEPPQLRITLGDGLPRFAVDVASTRRGGGARWNSARPSAEAAEAEEGSRATEGSQVVGAHDDMSERRMTWNALLDVICCH